MKVRELVNILEELPQDKEVMVGHLDIQDSFMDGYIKALHDNDLKFEGGKIVKNIEKYT